MIGRMAYFCAVNQLQHFRSLLFVPVFLFGLQACLAQTVHGVVTNEDDYILPGAQVYFLGTQIAGYADSMGGYRLPWTEGEAETRYLVTRQVGYAPDTTAVTGPGYHHIRLVSDADLETVTVRGRREAQYMDDLNPVRTEVVSSLELQKGACCDLAGCFNTNATVQKNVTNVITQAQELRILGLSGVYNQVLIDGFPLVQGLTYTYGIGDVPGSWIENIYISKGANSVLQGYESISGQINVELREPRTGLNTGQPDVFLQAYGNSFGEFQVNGIFEQSGEGWGNALFIHTTQPARRFDRDDDGFLDLPLVSRYSLADRLTYGDPHAIGWSGGAGLRLLGVERTGGQTAYQPDEHAGDDQVYGQWVQYTQPELWTRTAYRWRDNQRMVLLVSGMIHDQRSWYGLLQYKARQETMNASLQYDWEPIATWRLKTGVAHRSHVINETLSFEKNPLALTQEGDYYREDQVTGIYAESVSEFWDDQLTWILGARLDRHQRFGEIFTPRSLVKLDLWEGSSLRGSFGWGWRTANVFSEQIVLLAGNRDVLIDGDLRPEKAVNWGVNFSQKLFLGNMVVRWGADYYQTRFSNQIFPDFLQDARTAVVANFTDPSYSRAFQTDLDLTPLAGLQMKLAYNFLDVYREVGGERVDLPFNARHRLMGTVSYATSDGRWQGDVHAHWYGSMNLPNTSGNPEPFQRPDQSPDYATLTAQLTARFGDFDIYGGCENILDFRQKQPIVGWQDPFGSYFDTSSVWGPTRGREFYLGVRWNWRKG